MTAISLAIVVLVAALAGYLIGRRMKATPALEPAPRPAPSVPPAPRPTITDPPRPADDFGAEKARIIRGREAEAAGLRSDVATREAALSQLSEFSAERERLFRELADSRAELARYRQIVIDIENNAPPPILAGVGEPDDLKLIVGVGPVLERMLHNLGVTTFRQIARWSERDVTEFDSRLPEFPGRIQRDQWVTQARALHESKYGQGVPGASSRG